MAPMTRAAFAHLFDVRNGKIASMVQYVDTLLASRALVNDPA